jgi:hypothetical protein
MKYIDIIDFLIFDIISAKYTLLLTLSYII